MPAAAVPVPAFVGLVGRHHDLVAFAHPDLVVAARAAVGLLRFVRLHVTHLDPAIGFGPAVPTHTGFTVLPPGGAPDPERPDTIKETDVDGLLVERVDGIVTLTIDRPDRKNAINNAMWQGLVEIFDDIATRRDDRVLVVTGSGDAFCSGADVSSLTRALVSAAVTL